MDVKPEGISDDPPLIDLEIYALYISHLLVNGNRKHIGVAEYSKCG